MDKNKKNKKQSSGSKSLLVLKGFFKFLGRSILTLFMVAGITGSIVAVCILIIVLRLVDTNKLVEISKDRLSYTSIMYATDYETGEEYEYSRIYGKENRIWADLSDISPDIQKAFIAIEDKRFYNHNGVDFIRTSAAVINLVIPLWDGEVHGGSTITQQLIKNITGEKAQRAERKVQEIFSAMNVEKNYSKEVILEAYLNTISLGNNTNGVEAACQLYFGKSASDVNLAEAAMIAGVTKNPTKNDPSRHYDNAKDRQENILYEMWDQGIITEEVYEKTLKEEVTIVMNPDVQSTQRIQSYFEDNVIATVISDFMDQGYTEKEAGNIIYNKGVKIHITADRRVENILQEAYADYDSTFANVLNEEPAQSAFVITDPNGKILGMQGGTGTKDINRGFNRATMAKVQPGSTIKPFAAYGLGIEYNLITFSSIFEDSKFSLSPGPGQPDWTFDNYYPSFDGRMTVDTALQRSTNTVAVRVQQLVGYERARDFMQDQLGISTLVDEDLSPSPMGLGALTRGVIPLEWAGAYQIFGNGGTFTKPYCYTTVEDNDGNILLESDVTKRPVISEETSMIMNQLMQDVVYGPRGTGSYAKNLTGTRVAGKTGTSNDDHDQWFAGLTPDYVGVVWIGYDKPQTVRYGGGYPPPIVWTKVMSQVQQLAPEGTNFPISSKVVQLTYCQVSGNLASEICTATGTGYYKSDYRPPLCTSHSVITVDENGEIIENGDGEQNSDGINYGGQEDNLAPDTGDIFPPSVGDTNVPEIPGNPNVPEVSSGFQGEGSFIEND